MVTIANFRESQYPITSGTRCIKIYIPDDDTFKSLLAGLLALPSSAANYLNDDESKAAMLAQQWIDAYIQSEWNACGENNMVPIGTIVAYAASGGTPDGWRYCNGDEVLKADYAALYAVIGDLWGSPVLGSDYFVLPDFRNRSPFGYDIGNPSHQFPFASYQGAQTVTLTTAQIPAHSHSKADSSSGAGNYSSVASPYQGNGVPATGWNTGETGGGNPHNNLHPVTVCNFLIYAG